MNLLEKAYAEAKEELRKLTECDVPHEFVPTIPDKISSEHYCRKCHGTVKAIIAVWYKKGLEHGRNEKTI